MSLQFVTSLYLLSFSDTANLCFGFRTVYIVSNHLVFMSFFFAPSNLHLIVPKLSSYWDSCCSNCSNCCNCILGIQLRFQYHSQCPVIFLSFFLLSLLLSSVHIVHFLFSQSLGACMFSLVQLLVFLCSCQLLNFPSEIIFLLLYSHCTLVKSKFHMDIITLSYICFLNSSSVLSVTLK